MGSLLSYSSSISDSFHTHNVTSLIEPSFAYPQEVSTDGSNITIFLSLVSHVALTAFHKFVSYMLLLAVSGCPFEEVPKDDLVSQKLSHP